MIRLPHLFCVVLVVTLAANAFAQEQYATLIENSAEATVEETPTAIDFRLHKGFTDESIAQAAAAAQKFIAKLRDALKDAGYERASLRIEGPMIPNPQQSSVVLVGNIRLSLGGTGAEGSRSVAFGAVTDAIAAMAKELECTIIDGPRLDVANRTDTENKAVKRAIEYAYERAEAAAEVMRLNIVAVDNASIEEVIWHDQADEDFEHEASAERIGVTARVKVTYLGTPKS